VLVYKVLGAAALSGLDLDQLFELGKSIISNLYSIGVSFGACSLPGNPF
jgi:dihydroxyacetone kinase